MEHHTITDNHDRMRFAWVVFVLVFLGLGIFLRTYQFHDWLRFNADQSRDATVVSNYLEGKADVPLLGPKAGGTDFRVGPAFYYFQIAGAKIFGNSPDKMAYPDLLFALLSIPLLYFFLRKYFDVRTAILLTAIYAVSFFAVKYARFAWNPNSLPFWSLLFLYGLHEIMLAKENHWKRWSMFTGGAIGIGIQLHTLSLLLFSLVSIGVFGYLLYTRKRGVGKVVAVVIFMVIILNIPQIMSEVNTGGTNTRAFMESIGIKEKKGSGIVANTVKDAVCFAESSTYILSGYDSSDTCSIKSVEQGMKNVLAFIFGFTIFVGGFVFAIQALKKEEGAGKKYFLGLCIAYVSVAFLLFLPLANEISMRFFLATLFIPFVFLGLWWNFISEKVPRFSLYAVGCCAMLLAVMNVIAVCQSFADFSAYLTRSDAGMDNVLLKEVELSASFITTHVKAGNSIAVGGDAQYLFKALKSMQYFTSQADVKLVQKTKKTSPTLPTFLVENTKQKEKILVQYGNVADALTFGRFTIFFLTPR
jgi:hypothetical protein